MSGDDGTGEPKSMIVYAYFFTPMNWKSFRIRISWWFFSGGNSWNKFAILLLKVETVSISVFKEINSRTVSPKSKTVRLFISSVNYIWLLKIQILKSIFFSFFFPNSIFSFFLIFFLFFPLVWLLGWTVVLPELLCSFSLFPLVWGDVVLLAWSRRSLASEPPFAEKLGGWSWCALAVGNPFLAVNACNPSGDFIKSWPCLTSATFAATFALETNVGKTKNLKKKEKSILMGLQ